MKDKKNFEFHQCKGPNYTVGLQPQLLEGLFITHNTFYQYLCHGKRYYIKLKHSGNTIPRRRK